MALRKYLLAAAALAAPAALAGWSAPELVSPTDYHYRTCFNFATAVVATADNNLHAIFFEDGGGRVLYRRYNHAAAKWDAAVRLDETGGRDACICLDEAGLPHAFFKAGRDIIHRVGDLSGNWGPPQALSAADKYLGFPSPFLLPSGDIALAAVAEDYSAPAEIWYTTWRHDSGDFDPPLKMSASAGESGAWMPTLARYRGAIRLSWRDDDAGNLELYERVYEGGAWGPIRRLTYDGATTMHGRLAVDAANVLHLFFMDKRTGRPVIWEMLDGGGGWGAEHVRYDGGGEAYHPNVAYANDGRLLLFWEDNRLGNRFEVFYGALTGSQWSPGRRVTGFPATDSTGPSATVTPDNEVVVIYAEDGARIYVQRLPQNQIGVDGVTFRAAASAGGVELSWTGERLEDYAGFNLYRAARGEAAPRPLNEALVEGRPPFRYRDEPPVPGDYTYRLEGITRAGWPRDLGTARVTLRAAPPAALAPRVFPNPCRGRCAVAWTQPARGRATVAVYDAAGRRIAATTVDGAAGRNAAALAAAGLPPGRYLVEVRAAGAAARTSFTVAR